MHINELEAIGLTKMEALVYLALLELGSSTSGPIVQKSGAASSKIYEILEKLIGKGLVTSVITSGVKHFEACSPDRILDYMKEREEELSGQRREIEHILPELRLKQELSKHKNEATVFKGIKGVKTAMESVIRTLHKGDEYYVIGGMKPHAAYFAYIQEYHKRRAKKGINVKLLYSEPARTLAQKLQGLPETQIKFAPTQFLPSCFFLMYDTKTLITVSSEDDLTLFQIDNKGVTDSFIAQFHLLWSQETQVRKGLDAIQDVFEEMLEAGHCDLIGARGYFVDLRPEFIDDWEKRAIARGFTMRNIVDIDVKGSRITRFPFVQTRYTLPKEFSALSVFWTYGDKVAISNWVEKEPFILIIDNKHLHNLFKKQFESLWNQETRTLRGFPGVKFLSEDVLETGQDLYFIGATGGFDDFYHNYYVEWTKRRVAKGIRVRLLADQGKKGKRFFREMPLAEHYFLPKEFATPNVIWVYGNKVANVLWIDEPVVFTIENKLVADHYRKYYELLKKIATK